MFFDSADSATDTVRNFTSETDQVVTRLNEVVESKENVEKNTIWQSCNFEDHDNVCKKLPKTRKLTGEGERTEKERNSFMGSRRN